MNYDELSDFEVNRNICLKLYPEVEYIPPLEDTCNYGEESSAQVIIETGVKGFLVDYCNSWEDVGPLIEEYKICIGWYESSDKCEAVIPIEGGMHRQHDKSPTRAAAVCLLMYLEDKND